MTGEWTPDFEGDNYLAYKEKIVPYLNHEGIPTLDVYVNDFLKERMEVQEEALTTLVVAALRMRGWTVIEPGEDQ